jgi:hypothetical protein
METLDDVRPVRVVWARLDGLIAGAQQRGWREEQIEAMRSAFGVVWTRGYRTAEAARARGEVPPGPMGLDAALRVAADWSANHADYLRHALGLCWAVAASMTGLDEPAPSSREAPTLEDFAARVDKALSERAPRFALSFLQPWAWIVVHGGKRTENRTWKKKTPAEPFYIHASAKMPKGEYDRACAFASRAAPHLKVPEPEELLLGGIIGQARITGCRWNTPDVLAADLWAMENQYGYALTDVRPTPYVKCKGLPGIFWPVPEAIRIDLGWERP